MGRIPTALPDLDRASGQSIVEACCMFYLRLQSMDGFDVVRLQSMTLARS